MASAAILSPQNEQYIADVLQNTFNDLPSYINRLAETNNVSQEKAFKMFLNTVMSNLSAVSETPLATYLKANKDILDLESEIRFIKQIYAAEYNEHTKKYREWNEQYLRCTDNLTVMRNELNAAKESLKFATSRQDTESQRQIANLQSKIQQLTQNVNSVSIEKTKLKLDLDRARAELETTNQQLREFNVQNSASLQYLFDLLPTSSTTTPPLNTQEMSERLRKHIENSVRLQNTIDDLQNELRKITDSNRACTTQSNANRNASIELSELKTQYEYMKNMNRTLEKSINDCREYSKTLEEANRKLIEQNTRLTETNTDLESKNQDLNNKLKDLQTALDQYSSNYNQHAISRDEVKSLTAEIVMLNGQKSELIRQLEESQANINELGIQIQSNDQIINRYEQQFAKVQRDLETSEQARKSQAETTNTLQKRQSDLEEQVRAIESERDDLRARLVSQQNSILKLEEQRNIDLDHIKMLTDMASDRSDDEKITQLTNEIMKKDQFIATMQEEHTTQVERWMDETKQLNDLRNRLTETNDALKEKNSELVERLSSINDSYKELLKTNDELNARCREITNDVNVDGTIDNLATDRQQLIEEHDRTIASINQAHKESIDDLEAKINKINQERSDFEKELTSKNALYKSLMDKFDKAKNLYNTSQDDRRIFNILFNDPDTVSQNARPFAMFGDSSDVSISRLPLTPRPIYFDSTSSGIVTQTQTPNIATGASSDQSNAVTSSENRNKRKRVSLDNISQATTKTMRSTATDNDLLEENRDGSRPQYESVTMSTCTTVSDADRAERVCNIMQGTHETREAIDDNDYRALDMDTTFIDDPDDEYFEESEPYNSRNSMNLTSTNDEQTTAEAEDSNTLTN